MAVFDQLEAYLFDLEHCFTDDDDIPKEALARFYHGIENVKDELKSLEHDIAYVKWESER